MLQIISDLEDSQFNGKRVLVRVDFNVSVLNGSVSEDYRIRMTLPTIEYLSKRGSKVVLASHLGRPEGPQHSYSLEPVAKRLSEIIGKKTKVRFVNQCVGETVHNEIEKMNKGDILLLENLRFHKEEGYLSMIKENPIKPFTLVIGGVKIKDKIGALENLLPKADRVLIGGAAAYKFLKAKGINTGNSVINFEHLPWVTNGISTFGDKIMIPSDHVIASSP